MFSIIAHDLKNPFNIIIGYSELLLDDFKNEQIDIHEVKESIKIIHTSSQNAHELLQNLLECRDHKLEE